MRKRKFNWLDLERLKFVSRKAREGRNPRNPEESIQIPASKAPVFKVGKNFESESKQIELILDKKTRLRPGFFIYAVKPRWSGGNWARDRIHFEFI